MSLMTSAALGLGVGAACGAAWAAVALTTGYEYSMLTVGFGVAVGAAVAISAGKDAGNRTGILAVLATLGTVLGARLLVIDRLVGDERAAVIESVREVSDDEAMIHLAIMHAANAAEEGRQLAWPLGASFETADEAIDFPPEIWSAAVSTWRGFTPEEQDRFRTLVRETVEAEWTAAAGGQVDAAFTGSFSSRASAAIFMACIMAFAIGRTRFEGGPSAAAGVGAAEGHEGD